MTFQEDKTTQVFVCSVWVWGFLVGFFFPPAYTERSFYLCQDYS